MEWLNGAGWEMKGCKVKSKGQTTLPEDVHAAPQIDAGDMPRGGISGEESRIRKTTSVMELSGMLKRPKQAPLSVEEMHEAIAEAATL
jgi:bifunctional DNA-binding transcriptional regulator/antitoxin component of YhaV-PrlF toxin-antitoxin module